MINEETIFAEALGKGSAPERDAYLDQACAGNAGLRGEVDALLLAHERAGGILEGSPVGIDVMAESRLSSEGVGATVTTPAQINRKRTKPNDNRPHTGH